MAKQNVLQDVKNRMKKMQEDKAAQLEIIRREQEEARTQMEEATQAMKIATEEMNVDAYAEARNAKLKAQNALEVYCGRYEQIKRQEYISEAESDAVVDSLLAYENQLAEDFRRAAAESHRVLAKLYKEYTAAVRDAEATLIAWQKDIHANYNTRGAMTRIDPRTGERTYRSEQPIPVHRMPYTGCVESEQLGDYLKKAAPRMMD